MNWDAIGAISEAVGSIAVFVTLGYLAIQVRHARSEAQRALSQGREQSVRELCTLNADERISRAATKASVALGFEPSPFTKLLMEQSGLTRDEANLLFWSHLSWWIYRLSIIPHVDQLPIVERADFEAAIKGAYGFPGIPQLFYQAHIKPFAHPDAVRYITNLLDSSANGQTEAR